MIGTMSEEEMPVLCRLYKISSRDADFSECGSARPAAAFMADKERMRGAEPGDTLEVDGQRYLISRLEPAGAGGVDCVLMAVEQAGHG